jgi:tetraacyldisaccharide 4'-kinase
MKGSSVRLDEPAWWYGSDGGLAARCLQPLAVAWGAIAARRYQREAPYRSRLPVICIGNFTAGGTGKTPLAMCVAAELARLGRRPAFLTRGFGGRLAGPHWVDAAVDNAVDVGDEPLLLARAWPALVARDRRAGARVIEANEKAADVIIMDDGLQNPQLAKDLVLAVVDGRRGFGNGRVIPAGPLRAPLDFQLRLTDAVIVNMPAGATAASAAADWLRQNFPGPVLSAFVELREPVPWLDGATVVAFAGIGAPQRFFDLLGRLGANVARSVAFADHHVYSAGEAEHLLGLAQKHSALLVTTEKDWVRIDGSGGTPAALKAASRPLPVSMALDERDRGRLTALLGMALKAGNAPTS